MIIGRCKYLSKTYKSRLSRIKTIAIELTELWKKKSFPIITMKSMSEPHLPKKDINNLQLEISRKQMVNLSTQINSAFAFWKFLTKLFIPMKSIERSVCCILKLFHTYLKRKSNATAINFKGFLTLLMLPVYGLVRKTNYFINSNQIQMVILGFAQTRLQIYIHLK